MTERRDVFEEGGVMQKQRCQGKAQVDCAAIWTFGGGSSIPRLIPGTAQAPAENGKAVGRFVIWRDTPARR